MQALSPAVQVAATRPASPMRITKGNVGGRRRRTVPRSETARNIRVTATDKCHRLVTQRGDGCLPMTAAAGEVAVLVARGTRTAMGRSPRPARCVALDAEIRAWAAVARRAGQQVVSCLGGMPIGPRASRRPRGGVGRQATGAPPDRSVTSRAVGLAVTAQAHRPVEARLGGVAVDIARPMHETAIGTISVHEVCGHRRAPVVALRARGLGVTFGAHVDVGATLEGMPSQEIASVGLIGDRPERVQSERFVADGAVGVVEPILVALTALRHEGQRSERR